MGKEISIFEVWRTLLEQKKTVCLVWFSCMVLAVVYLLLVTPTYKAEVFLLPPNLIDVQPLNVKALATLKHTERAENKGPSPDASHYSIDRVYELFLRTLESRSVRRDFYKKHKLADKLGFNIRDDDPDIFFDQVFNQSLIVRRNVKRKEASVFVSVSFQGSDATLIAEILNNFIDEVSSIVSKRLVGEVMAFAESWKNSVQGEISSKKTLAKARRMDRIAALQEALNISGAKSDAKYKEGLATVVVNTEKLPLYMLSNNILKAEIETLNRRKDDAPFIEGLRDLEEQMAALNQIRVNELKVKVMFLDQEAFVPKDSERPRKGLVLLSAFILGWILGAFIGLIRQGLSKQGQVRDE